ncbi:MAG: hypothetical protein WC121_05570 [Candidatus Kapaibacterium sp.]
MKKVLILTFLAMMTLTLASCNWDPTGMGTGDGDGRGDDNGRGDKDDDKKERDGMMVRGTEGDSFRTPCDFYFTVESIVVTENNSDVATDRTPERTVTVTIVVTNADGTTETYTMTRESHSVTIGDCTIYLKGIEPIKSRDTDVVKHVAMFAITTG